MATWVNLDGDLMEYPTTQESSKMSKEEKKNFRHSYREYETIEEARIQAKRDTAHNFTSQDIWQRIEETVVPDVDISINPVTVTVAPVKA